VKLFLQLLSAGVALVAFSMLWSFLGDAASQRSDFGVVSGCLLAIVVIAAAVAWTASKIKRAQGPGNTTEKK
jgi:hypothetical protein